MIERDISVQHWVALLGYRMVVTMCALYTDVFCFLSDPLQPFSASAENAVGSGDAADDVCECSTAAYDATLGLCGEAASALFFTKYAAQTCRRLISLCIDDSPIVGTSLVSISLEGTDGNSPALVSPSKGVGRLVTYPIYVSDVCRTWYDIKRAANSVRNEVSWPQQTSVYSYALH